MKYNYKLDLVVDGGLITWFIESTLEQIKELKKNKRIAVKKIRRCKLNYEQHSKLTNLKINKPTGVGKRGLVICRGDRNSYDFITSMMGKHGVLYQG